MEYGAVEHVSPEVRRVSSRRYIATAVAGVAGTCLLATLVLVAVSPRAERTTLLQDGRMQQLEYFADMGYTNAERCNGHLAGAQQSPVAIDEGIVGMSNVVEEALPPFGWVGTKGGGLFRMKTPGTDAETGQPGVKLFVHGNKFDMAEAHVETMYGGNHYRLDHFTLKTPAEHTVDGVRYPMEQQFVHLPVGDGNPFNALIVSVFFKEHPLNSPSYVEKLYHAIPCMGEGKHCQVSLLCEALQSCSCADMVGVVIRAGSRLLRWREPSCTKQRARASGDTSHTTSTPWMSARSLPASSAGRLGTLQSQLGSLRMSARTSAPISNTRSARPFFSCFLRSFFFCCFCFCACCVLRSEVATLWRGDAWRRNCLRLEEDKSFHAVQTRS